MEWRERFSWCTCSGWGVRMLWLSIAASVPQKHLGRFSKSSVLNFPSFLNQTELPVSQNWNLLIAQCVRPADQARLLTLLYIQNSRLSRRFVCIFFVVFEWLSTAFSNHFQSRHVVVRHRCTNALHDCVARVQRHSTVGLLSISNVFCLHSVVRNIGYWHRVCGFGGSFSIPRRPSLNDVFGWRTRARGLGRSPVAPSLHVGICNDCCLRTECFARCVSRTTNTNMPAFSSSICTSEQSSLWTRVYEPFHTWTLRPQGTIPAYACKTTRTKLVMFCTIRYCNVFFSRSTWVFWNMCHIGQWTRHKKSVLFMSSAN